MALVGMGDIHYWGFRQRRSPWVVRGLCVLGMVEEAG